MGLFESIMHKIFHAAPVSAESAPSGGQAASAAPAPSAPSAPAASSSPSTAGQSATPANTAPPVATSAPVDVFAVLTQMAAQKGGGGNWQSSIVDLLKLLDLDSSLSARKQLAQEINVHVSADGSAEENIALHKAVMQKLAENGGKVPDNLKG